MSIQSEERHPASSLVLLDFELRFISMIVEAFECAEYRVFSYCGSLFIRLLTTRFIPKIGIAPDADLEFAPVVFGPEPMVIFTDSELVTQAKLPGFFNWLNEQVEIRSRH